MDDVFGSTVRAGNGPRKAGLECGREFYQRGAGESSIGAISLRDEMKHRHGVGVGASSAWHWCGREFCSGYSLLTLTGIPF